MSLNRNIYYSLASVILLSLPWLFAWPGWILFVGFVPLLLLEERLSEKPFVDNRYLFFNYSFLTFFFGTCFLRGGWVMPQLPGWFYFCS